MTEPTTNDEPFIPAEQSLPEITLKAIVLSVILTIVLGAANAYLGLRVGMTISASIPAAVISMGVLKLFKHSNVLENNIVQTAASSGEALTAGIIFTIPALIVIQYWSHFKYWPMVTIGLIGGTLGVLFSIPLRRVLLADKTLRFPEGTAIGNVLKASASEGKGLKLMVLSGGLGAVIGVCQTGFKLLASSIQYWGKIGSMVIGTGLGFNPALIGAGYIIGIDVAISILAGVMIGWVIGVPVLSLQHPGHLDIAAATVAMNLWGEKIRYIGLGVMMVGGLAAFISLLKPMYRGIVISFQTMTHTDAGGTASIPRTDKDISTLYVIWGVLLVLLPAYYGLYYLASHSGFPLGVDLTHTFSFVNLIFVLVCGLAVASVCAYFAGLVGSSTSPISSLTLITLILVCGLVMVLFEDFFHIKIREHQAAFAAGVSIIITSLISCTAAISNDTIQDLKTGQMVGATPWKQQLMLLLGMSVAAFITPGILDLLFNAYGLAGVFPRPGMDHSQMLLAPQAGLMATVAEGIFTHNIEWGMMITGGIIAVISLGIDRWVKNFGHSFPVLAVGLGIYLPVDTSTPLVLGGVLSYVVHKAMHQCYAEDPERYENGSQVGLMLASGLVAGAAIMGVLLAIPFVIEGSSNTLRILPKDVIILPEILGAIVTLGLCTWFYRKILDNA